MEMFNSYILGLYCIKCSDLQEYDPLAKFCPRCSQPLITRYDLEEIASSISDYKFRSGEVGVWKFKEFLPLNSRFKVTMGEGGTRTLRSTGLAQALKLENLYFKLESLNPTGTFIDRGVSVDISVSRVLGFKRVTTATLGDYGVSLSAYSVKGGLRPLIYMPSSVELNKLYQVLMLRGKVRLLESYSQCVEAALKTSEKFNYYLSLPSSHTVLDGYKTIAFEILEELEWKPPDYIVVPVGDGALLSAIHYGFKEVLEAGFLRGDLPKIVAVQSSASPAIAEKVLDKKVSRGRVEESIASDILVARPLMELHAVKAIRESRGTAVIVSDEEILEGMHLLAKNEGIIVEPTSAVGIAGLYKLVEDRVVDSKDKIIVVLTGSSFKDPLLMRRVIEYSREVREELSIVGVLKGTIGETKLKILEVIALHEQIHPYKIWKILTTSYGLELKPTTIYQHLKELEAKGLVCKSTAPDSKRRVYKLTSLGREAIWSSNLFYNE